MVLPSSRHPGVSLRRSEPEAQLTIFARAAATIRAEHELGVLVGQDVFGWDAAGCRELQGQAVLIDFGAGRKARGLAKCERLFEGLQGGIKDGICRSPSKPSSNGSIK